MRSFRVVDFDMNKLCLHNLCKKNTLNFETSRESNLRCFCQIIFRKHKIIFYNSKMSRNLNKFFLSRIANVLFSNITYQFWFSHKNLKRLFDVLKQFNRHYFIISIINSRNCNCFSIHSFFYMNNIYLKSLKSFCLQMIINERQIFI